MINNVNRLRAKHSINYRQLNSPVSNIPSGFVLGGRSATQNVVFFSDLTYVCTHH